MSGLCGSVPLWPVWAAVRPVWATRRPCVHRDACHARHCTSPSNAADAAAGRPVPFQRHLPRSRHAVLSPLPHTRLAVQPERSSIGLVMTIPGIVIAAPSSTAPTSTSSFVRCRAELDAELVAALPQRAVGIRQRDQPCRRSARSRPPCRRRRSGRPAINANQAGAARARLRDASKAAQRRSSDAAPRPRTRPSTARRAGPLRARLYGSDRTAPGSLRHSAVVSGSDPD